MFAKHIVPFGMKSPSYQSSWKFSGVSDRNLGTWKPTRGDGGSYLRGIVLYTYLLVNTVDGMVRIVQDLTNRGRGPPAEQFADRSTDIWETLSVPERGHTRATNDPIQLFMTFLLNLWVRDHG